MIWGSFRDLVGYNQAKSLIDPGLKNHQEEIELDLIVVGLKIIIIYC
jgi:hypothetical protein